MSRRKHHSGKGKSNITEGGLPRPPTKTIICRSRKSFKKKIPTELHKAVKSMGRNNRTSRVSNREFSHQFAQEVDFMFKLGRSHLKRAGRTLLDIFKLFA